MKKLLFVLALTVLILIGTGHLALADSKSAIQCGVNAAAGASGSDCSSNPSAPTDITSLITKVINILSVLAGAAAVIMLIVGGFRYTTSAGSETAVSGAKKTVMYALIGIAIVAVAQVVVHFVLNNIA